MTIPLLTSVALVQTVLLTQIDWWGARPDLMLLVVLIWSVVRGAEEGMVWGFIGGLVIDLFSGGPLGATVLALLAVALLAGQQWGQGIGSSVIRLLLLTFVAVLVFHLILLIILSWTGYQVTWGWAILQVAGPSALLNASLSPFVQRPLNWLERITRRERSFTL
ncbi:MAG: rod shape-determining protein MreD [Chloroflexi bacterium]|nr:rod shape-determining protein MreD [Chloroflexota bacterium]